MSTLQLVLKSLFHYRWVNLSVLAGVALTSAILSGALVVGDSVKESLRQNAADRLSGLGPVLVGGERFFTSELADRVSAKLESGSHVAPLLQIEGTASNRNGGRRVNSIQVLGVDERFWEMSNAGQAPEGFDSGSWYGINGPLAERISAEVGDTLIVRIELPGALSKDAPLSGESEQTTPFTAKIATVVDADYFGLYSLRAEQVPPSTIFVPLQKMEEILEQSGRANILAASRAVSADELAEATQAAWSLDDLQLEVRELADESTAQLVSARVFLDEAVEEALGFATDESSPVLTYLANGIRMGDRLTPYSMVAGVGAPLNGIVDDKLGKDEIILSEWLAEDLEADMGDEVQLSFYVVGRGRALEIRKASFTVAQIAPIGKGGWDESWTPEFPGIFEVDDLDDWEPGIPIDRDLIRDKDDDFWDEYRATPKAFISLEAAQSLWANRFGDATSIRFRTSGERDPMADQLRESLRLEDLGMAFRDPSAEAESAVANSFDFGSLFASMSFFLIVAALVLAGLVFVFGIEQRAGQIGLLLALGFSKKKVRKIFLLEALILAVLGAALGLLGGYVYTRAALYGMSGVWQEAAAGIEFVYHLKAGSLMSAFVMTVMVALIVVWFASRRVASVQPGFLVSGGDAFEGPAGSGRWDWILGTLALLGGLGCLFSPKEAGTIAEQGMFFGAGFLLTGAGVAACSILIKRFLRPSKVLASIDSLGRQHTVRRRGRSLAVVGLMAAGVFMVTAINSFRLDGERGAERRGAGTGGFAWVGESTLPIYDDLNGEAGKKKFGLDQFEESFIIHGVRVSDGEDASCLNLNRAQRPRLMGVNVKDFAASDPFTFTRVEGDPGPTSQWNVLTQELEAEEDGVPVIPGVIDQNTATYALQKGLGDLVTYETVSGESFAVRLVGFIDTSILQGSLIVSESNFIEFFPDAGGYRFFLMDGSSADELVPVSEHLTRMFGDLGLEMRTAAERLNEFNAVQNTYLSIFSTLGGLGIFLGTIGLAVVVGRNVMERKGQLGVMQAMGYTRKTL
ncbi:MAG: FtsX-like permease family protein, partial [Verrucomicrobiota bacterium]